MRIKTTALAIVCGLGLATACSAGGHTSGTSDTFVQATNVNIVTGWDPATAYSNEVVALQNIYESLTRYNPSTQKVEPSLATEWTKSTDGTIWTFHLRGGVKFHNGTPLDSSAAKAAIERTIALGGGPAYIWEAVDSIETPSPSEIVFHLKQPAAIDLIASSSTGAYIYDVTASGNADLGTWFEEGRDSGTGPYTVESWNPGREKELTLVKFGDYWNGWEGRKYKSIEFRVTPEVTTAWQLLQSGDVDFVERLTPEIFQQARSTTGIQTSETSSFQNLIALFNTADGPMADVRVRKAIRFAIDTTGLAAALRGAVAPANGIVPHGLLGAGEEAPTAQDLTEARALLSEAGFDGSNPLRLSLTYAQGNSDQQIFVTLLQSSLAQLGAELRATPMQWSAQWDQAKNGKRQDIFLMDWFPDYADGYTWFANLFHSTDEPYFNLSYLDDKQVDTQIDLLPAQTATDPEMVEETYRSLQRELLDEKTVAVPLYVQNFQRAYASSVRGYVDNPAYSNVVFVHDLTRSE